MPTFPVPRHPDGRRAVVSSGFKDRNPDRPDHDGADIMYPRIEADEQPVRDGQGAPGFIMPPGTHAVATASGTVAGGDAYGHIRTGGRIWIVHANDPFVSGYFHLQHILVAPGQKVAEGQVIGVVGHNPASPDPRHLHFEVSRKGGRSVIDPEDYLSGAVHRAEPCNVIVGVLREIVSWIAKGVS